MTITNKADKTWYSGTITRNKTWPVILFTYTTYQYQPVKMKVHFTDPTPGMVQNIEQLNIDDGRKTTPDEEHIERNSICTRSACAINMPARFKNSI